MFKAEFSTENDAFADAPAHESARILREIADKLERGESLGGGAIRDANGNTCGHWEMTPYSSR